MPNKLAKTETNLITEIEPFVERWEMVRRKGESYYDKMKELAFELGRILSEVKEKFGLPGFNAFAREVKISEKSSYNYLNLFKNKDSAFIQGLPTRKSLTLLPILEDEDVQITGDTIDFGDGIQLSLKEADGVTKEQLVSIVHVYKKQKRIIAMNEGQHKRSTMLHEAEKDALREELDKVRAEIKALTVDSETDPLDVEISKLEMHVREVTKRLFRLRKVEKEDHQISRLRGIENELANAFSGNLPEDM